MRSFAAIITFACIAFATITSALPTKTGAAVDHVSADIIQVRSSNTDGSLAVALGTTLGAREEPPRGIPDILTELNDKILPLCHDLNEKVNAAASAEVGIKAAMEILGEVKNLLSAAKGEIEGLVANPVEAVFCLKGKLLNAGAIANILAILTVAVSTALGFVIKAYAFVKTDELVNLVVEIAGILASIIGLLTKVIAALLADLTPLLHCVIDIIIDIKLTALIDVLQIGAGGKA